MTNENQRTDNNHINQTYNLQNSKIILGLFNFLARNQKISTKIIFMYAFKNEVFYSSIELIIYNSKSRHIILIVFNYVIEIEKRLEFINYE